MTEGILKSTMEMIYKTKISYLQILLVLTALALLGSIYSRNQVNLTQIQAAMKKPLGEWTTVFSKTDSSQTICKEEQKSIYYLKVHKTGSTTFSNIMSRFGIARNLTFAIFHFIHPYPTLNMVDYLIPHPKDLMNDKKFAHKLNIVNVHSVFNKSAIDLFMPADTQLVATMRHPFTQLQSAFNYYNLKRHLHIPDVGDPLKEFLKDPAKYDKLLPGSMYNHISAITGIKLSFTKNRMAFEFGFDLTQIHNTTYVQQHLMHIKKSFNIVIITEHYDESLLLLRKQFCWQYKDILYLGLRNHTYTGKNKSPDSFGEYYKSHKQWAPLDYLIYDQFLKIHRNSVESQGPKFLDEVAHFKKVLQQVNRYCSDICSPKGFRNRSINYLTVAKSVFHNDFFVTPKDCGIMMVSDTYLQNTIKLYQYWTFCATKPNIHVLKQQQSFL